MVNIHLKWDTFETCLIVVCKDYFRKSLTFKRSFKILDLLLAVENVPTLKTGPRLLQK